MKNNELINELKGLISDVNTASSPTTYFYGTVTKTNPLTVAIDEKYPVYGSNLIVGDRFTGENALQLKDRVLLIRFLGGAAHWVADRLR